MNRSTPEWLLAISLLSTLTDSEIARRTGLTRELIRQERRARGEAPFGRTAPNGLRRCTRCTQEKDTLQFGKRKVGQKVYFANMCLACDAERKRETTPRTLTSEQVERIRTSQRMRNRQAREDAVHSRLIRARNIFYDMRAVDKRKGLNNDLTVDFIETILQNACSYCGEQEAQLTLDRIDNMCGHTQANVVIACQRCNTTRTNMPYSAWLLVAPGMRAAREAGLFDLWVGWRIGAKRTY
jgi:5-methylcytosine-specific restriction endonuclease McrA